MLPEEEPEKIYFWRSGSTGNKFLPVEIQTKNMRGGCKVRVLGPNISVFCCIKDLISVRSIPAFMEVGHLDMDYPAVTRTTVLS